MQETPVNEGSTATPSPVIYKAPKDTSTTYNGFHLDEKSLKYYAKPNCKRCFGRGVEVYYNPSTKTRSSEPFGCAMRRSRQGLESK